MIKIKNCIGKRVLVCKISFAGEDDYIETKILELSPKKDFIKVKWVESRSIHWYPVWKFENESTYGAYYVDQILVNKKRRKK